MDYQTGLTERLWQYIKETLDVQGRKREQGLAQVWNAISYLAKTGCQWWMLPHDFPQWKLVSSSTELV
jgi:putative transposase